MENSAIKILLVDDEPDILEFLSYTLKKEGYSVLSATNGNHAIEIAKKENPQLIILDIMMPEMDGIEACQEIRSIDSLKNVCIAFLTARSEDYSQIAGFEVGADDYITKPIRPKVFLSRIKALLRRQTNSPVIQNSTIENTGELNINRENYAVTKKGKLISLRKKEFELLALLASKPGKVFTRDEILSRVWGDGVIVGDRTIDVHVNKLRQKVGTNFIKALKGVGYKFESE